MFTIDQDKVNDEEIADRRENFYQFYNFKPGFDESYESSSTSNLRKRDYKFLLKQNSRESYNEHDDSFSGHEGLGKRKSKRPLFYDEKFPPEDQKFKRQNSSKKLYLDSNISIKLSKKYQNMSKTAKNKLFMAELESDDEDYKMANNRFYKHRKKGYEAGNFLIRKYINMVKYVFDKLRVLSSTNYTKDIHLTANDIKTLCGKSLSNGYTYLDIDNDTKKVKLCLSRT